MSGRKNTGKSGKKVNCVETVETVKTGNSDFLMKFSIFLVTIFVLAFIIVISFPIYPREFKDIIVSFNRYIDKKTEMLNDGTHKNFQDQIKELNNRIGKLESLNDKKRIQDDTAKTQGVKTKIQDDKAKTQGNNAKTQDDKTKTQGDNAKAQDDKTKIQGDKVKAQDDKTKTQGDNAKAQDDKTKTQGDNAKAQDDKTKTQDNKEETQGDKVKSQVDKTNTQDEKVNALSEDINNLRVIMYVFFLLTITIIAGIFIKILFELQNQDKKLNENQSESNVRNNSDDYAYFTNYINEKISNLEFKIKDIMNQLGNLKEIVTNTTTSTQSIYTEDKYNRTPPAGGSNVNNSSPSSVGGNNIDNKQPNGEEFIRKLVQQYNNATQYEEQRRFEDTYKPVRLGVNPDTVMALGRGEAVEVSLENRPDGDYWAIDISKYVQYSNAFYVVPRFTPVDDTIYKAGAMGKVFDCINFNARYRFNYINLVKPALIIKDGSSWKVKNMGQIKLEQGEQIS